MEAQTLLQTAIARLQQAGCQTPRLDAELLLAHVLDKERTWLYVHPDEPVGAKQAARFWDLLSRRERREPVAYLTGRKEFFGLDFTVDRHVLIPRPETELLVETALQFARNRPQTPPAGPAPGQPRRAPLTVADIGTGSGCIPVALAKHLPQASFTAVDCSPPALPVARANAIRHGVAGRIRFLEGDLLTPLSEPVDFIISNPPYVSRSDLAATAPEVQQYEPRTALAGGQDGLAIISRLLSQAKDRLKPNGVLLVEIGAEQGSAVNLLAAAHFPEARICIKKDLAGLDRVLVVETGRARLQI